MTRHCTAREALKIVLGDREVAFIDLREIGPYSEGHPLFVSPIPFSRLEAEIPVLVPRVDVQIILIDSGDGVSEVSAGYLEKMGYSEISIIQGGAPEWARSGLTLFKGVNVPSKTLGELAVRRWHPAMVDPESLPEILGSDSCARLIDCRPPAEFQNFTIPGARCMPTGEMLHRFHTLGSGPVIITCAGRTRSIIGTIGLMLVAPKMKCLALENGTQGWSLAGMARATDNQAEPLPQLTPEEAAATSRSADSFMASHDIETISSRDVRELLTDTRRTTYCLDLRPEEVSSDDQLPAFRHVTCGQLLQVTDTIMGVRRARVVLADDLGMRAALSAFWMRALGYEVRVVRVDDELRQIRCVSGPAHPVHPGHLIDATAALDDVRRGFARILDLRHSTSFSQAHIAGSQWSTRPLLGNLSLDKKWYIVADNETLAALGASEMQRLGFTGFAVVKGGFRALSVNGGHIQTGIHAKHRELIDIPAFAHGRHDGNRSASLEYLAWEKGLVDQLSNLERSEFHL